MESNSVIQICSWWIVKNSIWNNSINKNKFVIVPTHINDLLIIHGIFFWFFHSRFFSSLIARVENTRTDYIPLKFLFRIRYWWYGTSCYDTFCNQIAVRGRLNFYKKFRSVVYTMPRHDKITSINTYCEHVNGIFISRRVLTIKMVPRYVGYLYDVNYRNYWRNV